jgi:hypothetical protein
VTAKYAVSLKSDAENVIALSLERGEKKSVMSAERTPVFNAKGDVTCDFENENLALDATLYQDASGDYMVRR